MNRLTDNQDDKVLKDLLHIVENDNALKAKGEEGLSKQRIAEIQYLISVLERRKANQQS